MIYTEQEDTEQEDAAQGSTWFITITSDFADDFIAFMIVKVVQYFKADVAHAIEVVKDHVEPDLLAVQAAYDNIHSNGL